MPIIAFIKLRIHKKIDLKANTPSNYLMCQSGNS